jgi:hypothetical protein
MAQFKNVSEILVREIGSQLYMMHCLSLPTRLSWVSRDTYSGQVKSTGQCRFLVHQWVRVLGVSYCKKSPETKLALSGTFYLLRVVLVGHICATYISFCYVRGRPETPRIQPIVSRTLVVPKADHETLPRPVARMSPISNCQEFAIGGE